MIKRKYCFAILSVILLLFLCPPAGAQSEPAADNDITLLAAMKVKNFDTLKKNFDLFVKAAGFSPDEMGRFILSLEKNKFIDSKLPYEYFYYKDGRDIGSMLLAPIKSKKQESALIAELNKNKYNKGRFAIFVAAFDNKKYLMIGDRLLDENALFKRLVNALFPNYANSDIAPENSVIHHGKPVLQSDVVFAIKPSHLLMFLPSVVPDRLDNLLKNLPKAARRLISEIEYVECGLNVDKSGITLDMHVRANEDSILAPLIENQKASSMRMIRYLPEECFIGGGVSFNTEIVSEITKLVSMLLTPASDNDKPFIDKEWLKTFASMLALQTGDGAFGVLPPVKGEPGFHFVKIVEVKDQQAMRCLARKYMQGFSTLPLPFKVDFKITPGITKIDGIQVDKIEMILDRSKFSPAVQLIIGMIFTQEINMHAAFFDKYAVITAGPKSLDLLKDMITMMKKKRYKKCFVDSDKYKIAVKGLGGKQNFVAVISPLGLFKAFMKSFPVFPPDKIIDSQTGIGIGISTKGRACNMRIFIPTECVQEMKKFFDDNKKFMKSINKFSGAGDDDENGMDEEEDMETEE